MTRNQRDGSEPEFCPLMVPKKPAPAFRAQTSWKLSKQARGQSEIWDLDSLLSSARGRSVCQPWERDTCNLPLRINPRTARCTWKGNGQPDWRLPWFCLLGFPTWRRKEASLSGRTRHQWNCQAAPILSTHITLNCVHPACYFYLQVIGICTSKPPLPSFIGGCEL